MKNTIAKFIKDESGQTTTEYILILAVVVTLIMQFKKQFTGILRGMFTRLESESEEIWDDVE